MGASESLHEIISKLIDKCAKARARELEAQLKTAKSSVKLLRQCESSLSGPEPYLAKALGELANSLEGKE